MLFGKLKIAIQLLAISVLTGFGLSAQITADFTSNRTTGCSPLIVQFTDLSTGPNPILTWNWNFGNGNVSTQKNPGAIYINPGVYNVRLIVFDGISRDTIIRTSYITVFQDPTINILTDTTQGCAPVAINFSDNSTPGSAPIVTWIWDFGDGTTSLLQNPAHTYINPGNYNVTLSLVDLNGCNENRTYNNLIQIGTIPTANYGSDVNSACFPPLTVNFSDSSTGVSALNYLWDFGDGNTSTNQNPANTYLSLGVYDVKLHVADATGCEDSITKVGFVAIEDLMADFTSNVMQGCVGQAVQFTDISTSNPSNWQWDFGDGNTDTVKNPLHVYTASGMYSVTLIASNSGSCADTIQKINYILINPSPVADFTADVTQSCSAPLPVNFSDLSANAISWQWNFGDGNTSVLQHPTNTYFTSDSFTVSLIVGNIDNCYDTITRADFILISPPRVAFDAQGRYGCAPRDVEFGDSSISINPIVNWLWDFGDGNTSTLQHPVHIYPAPGSYHVSLTIIDSDGCNSTLVDSNFVGAGVRPTADFTANPLVSCIFLPVNFFNNTTNSTSWHWEFGDGGTDDTFEPTHTYGDTGYFSIRLIARDHGCADTLDLTDYVYVSPPDAIFTVAYDCADPLTVSFIDGSLAPDTWHWDFGDGAFDSVPSPVHTYPGSGTYHVILTCTNIASGCVDIEEQDVIVTVPAADFVGAPTFGCKPHIVNFTDNSVDAVVWSWISGGMTSTSQNPSFTYINSGVYDVTLIVNDIHGCRDTMTKVAYVTVTGPIADFTSNPTSGCAPLLVNFTDISTQFLSPVTDWNWSFGDGNTSTLQHPTHNYSATGFYTISLTVTDADGCQHSITRANHIQPTYPTPDFSADTFSCTTRGVQFVNSSVGVSMNFLWDFGDGTTSTSTNPLHLYSNEGIYTISITTTDVNGCDSTLVKPNYVRVADPVADFGADNTFAPCPPLLVNFGDSSNDATTWHWTFGDGSNSTLQTPSHLYVSPGTYDVQLIVTSALGCRDTLFRDDYIQVLGPNGTFTFAPPTGCLGQQVDFAAVTVNTAMRTWDFGDGTILAAGDTVSYIYNTEGIYRPTIILDDGIGCIYAVTSADSIVIGDITPDFSANEVEPCPYENIQFTDLTTSFPNTVSRKWHFGDGDSSGAQNPVHAYATAGFFDVILITYNGICYDTMFKPSYIYVTPFPYADFTMSVASGCENINVIFNENSITDTAIAIWAWDFNDGTFDNIQNPAHAFTTGNYNVQLVATSLKGCSDTVSKAITVFANPVAFAGPDSTVCAGTPVQLNGTGAAIYQWSPALGLDDSTLANPTATPIDTTDYHLTVTDSNGCTDTDSVVLNIKLVPVAIAVADVEICVGNSIEIFASGGSTYSWSPSADLSCATCSNPIATPDSTTLFSVVVTNGYNCTDSEDVRVTVRERPIGIITPDTDICIGESVQLESQGGAVHFWGPVNNSLNCTSCENPIATPDTTTLYSVLMYNIYNCETYDSLTVIVHPLPVITIQAGSICVNDTGQILSTGGAIYNWNPSVGLSCDNCPNPFVFADTTTTYQLEVISSFACVNYDSVTIDVLPAPTVQTIEDATICAGDEIELTTTYSGTDSINWGPVSGIKAANIPSPDAKPDVTTQYTVTAVNAAGCSDQDAVTITVITRVEASVGGDIAICDGESAQLEGQIDNEGNLGSSVIWFPVNNMNNPTSLTPVVNPNQTITYTMVASSGSCIPDSNSVTVTVYPLPNLELGSTQHVLEDSRITLTPLTNANVAQYDWEFNTALSCFDCENPVATIGTSAEKFHLTIVDTHGCSAEDSLEVLVVGTCADNVFVPQAFSPNGDERNDVLYVRGLVSELKYFRVFDRWGNLVFQTTDVTEGWNGLYKGKKMNPAVFVYSVEAECENGIPVYKKGNVTLIR